MADTHYKTSDTALATFLITQGNNLVSIDYSQPRYEYFFLDSQPLRDLATAYLLGNALADPAVLMRVNKKLLRIIRNGIQWGDD